MGNARHYISNHLYTPVETKAPGQWRYQLPDEVLVQVSGKQHYL
jgi:hypothetical protein